MPSRHRRRRRTAAAVGAVGAAATLAICGAPGTYAAFSDFGTVGVQADTALWGDITPGWLAHCGDLDQYDEIVYADAVSILGASIATVDGDTPWLDTGHPKVVDLHSGGGDNQIILGVSHATNIFYGGKGNDCLVGGDETDVLAGDGGDDVLLGGDGADFLFGMSGADTMYGGSGFDTMAGGLDPGDAVYWEGLLKDLPLAWPWQIHTPDPTAGVHLLLVRSMGLAAAPSEVSETDTTACSESMSAALPDTPPTGAGAQDLIDSLNTTKAQCLAGDDDSTKGSLTTTPPADPSSSATSSDPAAPKTETSSSDEPTPTESATATSTPSPTPTPTAASSSTAPADQPSGDTASATGTASASGTGAATTGSSEGGQS